MSCPYPEGCNCGVLEILELKKEIDRLKQEIANMLKDKKRFKSVREAAKELGIEVSSDGQEVIDMLTGKRMSDE